MLLIQDTTNLDFAHHPSTKGLGQLDNLAQYGMKFAQLKTSHNWES